jgi:hypothetical protein
MKNKTIEQTKAEIIAYVTRTSIHTFIKPKRTADMSKWVGKWEYKYDYTQFTYFKIKLSEDKNFIHILEDNKNTTINIDEEIKWHGADYTKNVIKQQLFSDKKMLAVKSTKFIKETVKF